MIFDRVQQAVKELSSWKLAICEDDGDARPSKHSIRQIKGPDVEPGCLWASVPSIDVGVFCSEVHSGLSYQGQEHNVDVQGAAGEVDTWEYRTYDS